MLVGNVDVSQPAEDTESVALLRVSQTHRLPYDPGVARKSVLWFVDSAILLK